MRAWRIAAGFVN